METRRSSDTTNEERQVLDCMLEERPTPVSPIPTSQPEEIVPDWNDNLCPAAPTAA